jgi:hypothetical protein
MSGHFDGALLRRFIATNGVFPVGSRVLLDTGETARVERQTDQPLSPVVRTETAPSGEGLFYDDAQTIDLRETFGRNRIAVERILLGAEG